MQKDKYIFLLEFRIINYNHNNYYYNFFILLDGF